MSACRHKWERDESSGRTENPGCWSNGNGGFIFHERCAKCGLMRRAHHPLHGVTDFTYRFDVAGPWIKR